MAQLIDKANRADGISAKFEYSGDPVAVGSEAEKLTFRCIQELVNNTIQHGVAKNISVYFRWLPDKLTINVKDDGKGFDFYQEVRSSKPGLGLKNIQNRLEVLGASLDFSSKKKGVDFIIIIPLKT